MSRSYGFSAQLKAADASTTVIFGGSDLPEPRRGESLVGLIFELVGGTNLDLGAVSSIRVKAGSWSIVDISSAGLRAWHEQFSRGHKDFGAAANRWTLWLNLLDMRNEEAADQCAFPNSASLQVETAFDATPTVAGTMRLGYVLSNVDPVWSPVLRQMPCNVAASQSNGYLRISEQGRIRAVGFNGRTTNGIDRAKAVFGGVNRIEGTQEMIRAACEESGPATVTDSSAPVHWLKMVGMPVATGQAYLELDTGSASTTADAYGLWALEQV